MKRVAILLFVAAAALGACKKSDKKADLPPASGENAKPLPDIAAMGSAAVDGGTSAGPGTGSANESASTTGSLVARAQVTIGAKASGTLTSVNFDEGQKVKKGDVLFRVDSSQSALMRKQAQTQLDSAKLQLKTAQREYDRVKALVDQNAAPRVQLDGLDSQVQGARLAIVAAQNSLAMANKQISDATVRSPMDGVVLTKLMNVGEYATLMPPSPVMVLQDQASLDLEFNLPEKALAAVHIKDKITVTIPALGVTRTAEITEISPMVNPVTRTIKFTARLDNKDGQLKPGLMAEVTQADAVEPTPEPPEPEEAKPEPTPEPTPEKKPVPAKPVAPKKKPAPKAAAKVPT